MATPKNTTKDKGTKTPEKAVADKAVQDKANQAKPATDKVVDEKDTASPDVPQEATSKEVVAKEAPAETDVKATVEKVETEPKQPESAEPETKTAPQKPETGKGETTVIVLCTLPQGISFALPNGETFTLKGKNAGLIYHGACVNRLAKDTWQTIKSRYGSMQAFENKAIIEETSEARAKSLALELSGVKTGFEAVDPDKPGKDLTKATGQS